MLLCRFVGLYEANVSFIFYFFLSFFLSLAAFVFLDGRFLVLGQLSGPRADGRDESRFTRSDLNYTGPLFSLEW